MNNDYYSLQVSLEDFANADTRGEVKRVFEEHFEHIKFDKKLAKRVLRYISGFVNKNEDSVNFFGDALLGVYPVRFTKEDKDIWFDEVLDVDEISLRKDLHSLEIIEPKFKVSSDVTNHSYVWLAYKFLQSNDIPARDKEDLVTEIISMMQYKFLTSLMAHNFPYAADKSVALATYNSLSKKFSLKVYGSWAKLINARSKSIIGKDSIHHNTLQNYSIDKDIVKLLNDVQGRIREVIKSMLDVFYNVIENDSKIASVSSVIEMDGVRHVVDKSNNYQSSRRFINQIVDSRNDFIKDKLLKIVLSTIHTASERHLEDSLEFISNNYSARKMEYLKEFLDTTLIYSLGHLRDNEIDTKDLPLVLTRLRAIFMSSRNTEPLLVQAKELGDKLIEDSVSTKNNALRASTRTATMLYVVLRTLTESYFD